MTVPGPRRSAAPPTSEDGSRRRVADWTAVRDGAAVAPRPGASRDRSALRARCVGFRLRASGARPARSAPVSLPARPGRSAPVSRPARLAPPASAPAPRSSPLALRALGSFLALITLAALPTAASAAPRGVFPQPVNTPRAVTLSWERPTGGGVTATRIERRVLDVKRSRWRAVKTVRGNSTKITGLKAGTRYRFRIRFRTTGKAFGKPGPSVIVRALGRKPAVVSGLRAAGDGPKVVLSWPAAKDATSYRLERTDVLAGRSERIGDVVRGTTATDTPPARLAGHWLRYRVVARDGGAEAARSAPVEVRAVGLPGYTSYWALGDSYAAGTGLGQPYADQACSRSGRMWATLIPRDLVPAPQQIACSGATTRNVRLTTEGGFAQVADVGGTQLDRVLNGIRATPGPTLVTLSIGGNDARFVPQFTRCITGDCTADAETETALIRGTVRRNLDATFDQIRRVAPGADVLVAGYPKLFSEDAIARDPVFALTLTQAERKLANVWATQVDEEVAASARAHGLHPVTDEVLRAFDGHGAGGPSPWINTVQPVDVGTPIGMAPALPATASIHPTVDGNQAYADVMTAALRAFAAKVQVR